MDARIVSVSLWHERRVSRLAEDFVIEMLHITKEFPGIKANDDITLQLRVKNGVIEDAGFIGSGCAISQASASLMIDLVKGRPVEDARRLLGLYFKMIKDKITPEELDELEDAAALQGIAHVPARVKCAVLAWHTLEEALDGEGKVKQ